MAIKPVAFRQASFGRMPSSSFSNTLRQNQQDEENKRRYEIAQARLQRQDELAAQDRAAQNLRLATADTRAQTTFDQSQADRALAQKSAEIAGSIVPTSPYEQTVTPTITERTPEEIAAIKGVYQGEAGDELLGQDPRAQVIEQRLAELSPQIAQVPVESGKEQIARAITTDNIGRTGIPTVDAAIQASGLIGDAVSGAKDWYQGTTTPVDPVEEAILTPFDEKQKAFDANQAEFNKLTAEYTGIDKDIRAEKANKVLADVGSTYTKNITDTMPRTAQGFRKAQVASIDKTMDEQKVPKKDRAALRAQVLKQLDPRAIEQSKIASQYRKDKTAQRNAEIAAAGKVKETAVTQREKANTQYYKSQEADLKRLDNERKVLATLYSDDKFDKDYLAKDAAFKAQQQRIRDTLKKQ